MSNCITVPESYAALIDLLDKYTLVEQNTVIVRMRKCNHASLSAENKDRLIVSIGPQLSDFRSPILYERFTVMSL